MEILENRASCGRAIGKVESWIIPSGQRGCLVMKIHPPGQPAGPHTWKANVSYRRGKMEKEITVDINVRLLLEATVQPGSVPLVAGGDLVHVEDR